MGDHSVMGCKCSSCGPDSTASGANECWAITSLVCRCMIRSIRFSETRRKGNTMKTQTTKFWTIAGLTVLISLTLLVPPALSHHSFAMYDQNKVVTLTGVV